MATDLFLAVTDGCMLRNVPIRLRLLNWWISSLVRGAIDRACVDLSNLEVPCLWFGTFMRESMRLREVFIVRIELLSGIPLAVLI